MAVVTLSEKGASVALLDLATTTSRILKTYQPLPSDAALSGSIPVWSPDEEWMAYYIGLENFSEPSIWIADDTQTWPVSPDSKGISSGTLWVDKPAISPDGEWIAVPTTTGVGLIHAGDWEAVMWPFEGRVGEVIWSSIP
jgi:hypothetical protein